MYMDSKHCARCKIIQPLTEFYLRKSGKLAGYYDSWCKTCQKKCSSEWVDKNRARKNAYNSEWRHARGIRRPLESAKDCASYLGVHVAERVLSAVFENIERMPTNNPGYDFICGKGYKIDVKSSCLYHKDTHTWWAFTINRNATADYFLCLAFDDRKNLNPMHVWLIPGNLINQQKALGISNKSLRKWSKFERPLDKVIESCRAIRRDTKPDLS